MEDTLKKGQTESTGKLNRFTFGFGTIGRDMVYTLVSMFLIFYLTDVVGLPDSTMWWVTAITVAARIFDALNDPVMGTIVDNTKTKWGKFKPWIAFGAVTSAIFTILLFTDFGLTGAAFVGVFAIIYLMWGITYTTNDISYWSMLPSLSISQKEREKIGAVARICANIGLFAVVAGIVPITDTLTKAAGSQKQAYFIFALIVAGILILGQTVTLFGVKEPKNLFKPQNKTTLRSMLKAIFKNDQLLTVAISMVLFMTGYVTTTSFGIYFFKYAFKNEDMYSIFAVVLGVSQILALIVFPFFSAKFSRKKLYLGATILVFAGYILFFFSPMNMIPIGIAGVLIFVGQAFMQLLMLVFLTDTIEYGQWKSGKRNESVTFALQPFINKLSGAIAFGIVGVTLILSGINEAKDAADVTAGGLTLMKIAMLIIPMVFIIAGFIVYHFRYKIDKKMYNQIIEDLKERGDIESKAN